MTRTQASPADILTPPAFSNEPLVDFGQDQNSNSMLAALESVRARLGEESGFVIAGRRIGSTAHIASVNPAWPSEVIGLHAESNAGHANQAVAAAVDAFPRWRIVPVEERAALLFRAAAMIRARKFDFSAWLVCEVGKNWVEADADTAESIDFLEFYAREALRLSRSKTPIQYPGEQNELLYIPLGAGVVIPPWNFPLAIATGMTAAAIVTGNTVVLKPSPFAPTVAARLVEVFEQCGMPPGVINLCNGGAELGRVLVAHPQIRFIAFTGSKAAGLEIHETAARRQPAQISIKRTILEMGGKDSIIVEADADLEIAADGVIASAFGFSGQKCSACSRVIVDEKKHDAFLEQLVERVKRLGWGDPAANHPFGPVVSLASYDRVLSYIEVAKQEGRVIIGGNAMTVPEDGFYIAPTIVADVSPAARICQEEIFGPVLAILRSHSFEHALSIANNTEYGLTGAVYTACQDKIARAREEFHVGNLYINRKCTGAMVGAHPFGGFNMSGTDSKAGGPDYLLLFTQAKSVARKLNS